MKFHFGCYRLQPIPNARDIFEILAEGDGDREWLQRVYDKLSALRPRGLALDRAEYDDRTGGSLTFTMYAPGVAENVRPGDKVAAGFAAMRDPEGDVTVRPRLFRKLCANGAVVYCGLGEAAVVGGDNAGEAVERCLSGAALRRAAARLRAAASTEVTNPNVILRRAGARAPAPAIVNEFERAGDRTAWGLVNAVTSHARGIGNLRRRLAIEERAELILQYFEGGARGRAAARERRMAAVT